MTTSLIKARLLLFHSRNLNNTLTTAPIIFTPTRKYLNSFGVTCH